MKRIVLFAFCSMALLSAKAQDIIIFTSGEEVEAKVVEVSDTEVKYKTWSNQTGPTWVKKTSDIFMIRYENGTKQTFSTATQQPVQQQPIQQQVFIPTTSPNIAFRPTREINNSFCFGVSVKGGYKRTSFMPGGGLLDYNASRWSLSYASYLDFYPSQVRKNGSPFCGFGVELMYSNRGGTIKKDFDPIPFTMNLQYFELRPSFSIRDDVAFLHLGVDISFLSKATATWTDGIASEPTVLDMKEYDLANTPMLGVWCDFGFYIGKHFTMAFDADFIFAALNDGGSGVIQPYVFQSGETSSVMWSIGVSIGWLFSPMKIDVVE